MTQSEVEADRLYGEVSVLAFTDSIFATVNLIPPSPHQFYQEEEEEIVFDDAPQPEQEPRLSKHELKANEKGISQYLSFDSYSLSRRDLDVKIHLALEKGMSKE